MRTAFRSDESEIQALLQAVYSDAAVSTVEFQDVRDKADQFLKDRFLEAPPMAAGTRSFSEEPIERPVVARVGEENVSALLAVQKAADAVVEGMQKIALDARRKKLSEQERASLKRALDARLGALVAPAEGSVAPSATVAELLTRFDHVASDLRQAIATSASTVASDAQPALAQGARMLIEDAIEYQLAYVVLGFGASVDRL